MPPTMSSGVAQTLKNGMNEDTPFPKRDSGEFPYELSTKYSLFYDEILDFALGLTRSDDSHKGAGSA